MDALDPAAVRREHGIAQPLQHRTSVSNNGTIPRPL